MTEQGVVGPVTKVQGYIFNDLLTVATVKCFISNPFLILPLILTQVIWCFSTVRITVAIYSVCCKKHNANCVVAY